jgi:hypothetical protein
MCVTRGIHSLFAVAVLLLCAKRLFARAWRRCVSRCDVRDRRSVEWDDGVRYLWGCLVVSFLGSLAHGVVVERQHAVC